jgi:hypothetical protein
MCRREGGCGRGSRESRRSLCQLGEVEATAWALSNARWAWLPQAARPRLPASANPLGSCVPVALSGIATGGSDRRVSLTFRRAIHCGPPPIAQAGAGLITEPHVGRPPLRRTPAPPSQRLVRHILTNSMRAIANGNPGRGSSRGARCRDQRLSRRLGRSTPDQFRGSSMVLVTPRVG